MSPKHLMTAFLIRVWPDRSGIIKQVWQICMINLSYSVYIHVFRELKGSHSLRQRKSHVHALCPQNAEAKRSSWKFHKNEQGVTFIASWLSKILLYFLRTLLAFTRSISQGETITFELLKKISLEELILYIWIFKKLYSVILIRQGLFSVKYN